jgi:prevent-host-death family protein
MIPASPKKRIAKSPRSDVIARSSEAASARSASRYTVNATQAKNQFGAILRRVRTAAPVFIEKHGAAQAVVLDIGSYLALLHKARDPEQVQLDSLRDEFEALYAKMQAPASRKAVDMLSSTSAQELNRAAARRTKSRG